MNSVIACMGTAVSGNGLLLTAETNVADRFMIKGLFSFELFGQTLWLTTTHACLLVIFTAMIVFAIIVNRRFKKAEEVPGTFQNIVEFIVEMLDNMVKGLMGKNWKSYANYLGTLMLFLLICNTSGVFGLRPPTADFGVTLPLGLISFGLIQYANIKNNRIGAFTGLFKPLPFLFPINLIGEIATPISLSLRLFGNMISGTVMMALIYGLLPIFLKVGIPSALHVYFDLFAGCIQAYVFCMLTMTFVNDKIGD